MTATDYRSIITCSKIPEERAKAIQDWKAEILATQPQIPSFLSVVVEHQKRHPDKFPMQCMKDAGPEYELLVRQALGEMK